MKTLWSRRTFLSTAGLLSASTLVPSSLRGEVGETRDGVRASLVCTAFRSTRDRSRWHLSGYAVHNAGWARFAGLDCAEAVGAIAVDPHRHVVYVAHDTDEYLGLPRSSVSSFAIDAATGTFGEISRAALALSAIRPRHLAISLDGQSLLVSATGGGAYNMLSIAHDGKLLPHPRTIKLTGCGPHPLQTRAQPRFACFAPSGQAAYGCDFGSDRIDQIGFAEDLPCIESRAYLAAGTGPSHLAIHPSRRVIAVVGGLRPTLTMIETEVNSARLGSTVQELTVDADSLSTARFSAQGSELYVAGKTGGGRPAVFVFELDRASHALRQTDVVAASRPAFLADYALVATNVPLPYSPMATSPVNVLPETLPVNM